VPASDGTKDVINDIFPRSFNQHWNCKNALFTKLEKLFTLYLLLKTNYCPNFIVYYLYIISQIL